MNTRRLTSALMACVAVGSAAVSLSADPLARAGVSPSAHAVAQAPPPTTVDQEGRALFATYCASCHGVSARGDGPIASSLRVRPGDLTQFAAKNGGVFPAAKTGRIIDGRDVGAHGNPDMPVWGRVFRSSQGAVDANAQAKARVAAIVRFLESIQERSS